MDDKTLLERAARAIGVDLRWQSYGDYFVTCGLDENGLWRQEVQWNPLTDDGDEARLEAALNLHVKWGHQHVVVGSHPCNTWQEAYYLHNGDKQKARRYAGVRAAAAIGSAHEAQ